MDIARTGVLAPAAPALLAGALLAGCGGNPVSTDVSPASGVAGQVGQVAIRNLFVLGGEGGAVIKQGGSAPVYLTMVNSPSSIESFGVSGSQAPRTEDDTLTSVSSPQAASTEIIGGPVRLPAGQDVQIGPSAKIVMRGLKKPLSTGQFILLTLHFQRSGSGSLNAPVQARQGDLQSYSPAP
ncbi:MULTISPECIES: copper chaperone PCu(A)C [unclassified Actinomadura]|uniref:copper chaperone PCu(A)C n=1 Tax=unclassified Actinomadura TaxID=2626254 RepID=UPI0011EE157E|nr:copper chaperone PCu(A)C [Actinomadura sp. K4S16]